MKYEYWLANIAGISAKKKCYLKEQFGSAEALYYIEEKGLKERKVLSEKERISLKEAKEKWDLDVEYGKMEENGISCSVYGTETYPKRLLTIPSPPYAIYGKGKPWKEEKRTAAIVGARECSTYGKRMAETFAAELAKAGVVIVSGLARGIDAAGQQSALSVGGISYGVLGNGVDVCYPREHIDLYMELQEKGGLLSEQPPGKPPLPQYFPARNRIISGLADIVLVMEAKERSGSLITVDMALEQGKDVYALPGPVNSVLSAGCNRLIRQGAGILLSPEELLEELHILGGKTEKNKIVLESTEKLVYSSLGLYPKNLDEIVQEVHLPVEEVLNLLLSLELQGYIKEISKHYYIKVGSDTD